MRSIVSRKQSSRCPIRLPLCDSSPRPFRPLAHRLPPRRQRAHLYLQLALCPPQPRHHGPAPRRHRRRAQHRGQRPIHLRGPALAGLSTGTKSTSNPSASPCTAKQAEAIFAKGLAYRDFTPAHAGEDNHPRARRMALQPRHARTLPRRKRPPRRRRRALRPPLSRPPRRRPHPAASPTASTASSPSSPTRSKTSPCFAQTACPPTTWPPASTTPISASATSSAARITSPTPSSTC